MGICGLVGLRMGTHGLVGLSMRTHGLVGVGAHILYCIASSVPPCTVVTTAVLHPRKTSHATAGCKYTGNMKSSLPFLMKFSTQLQKRKQER